jgi:hypothetical protein
MPGDWGSLDCPGCGATQPPPEGAVSECDALIANMVCSRCWTRWQVRVELWRYYGVAEELPSREADR